MSDHEADVLILWLGLGGLAMFAGILAIVSFNRDSVLRHAEGSLGIARDNIVVMLPALLLMGLLVLRGTTAIEHAAIWPLPLVALAVMAICWTWTPAVRRAAKRVSAVHGKPSR